MIKREIYCCSVTGQRSESFSFGYDEEHPACIRIKQALCDQVVFLAGNGSYIPFTL